MVWPTEVTGLTSNSFEADESYHFPGNFRRPGKADESYLTSVGAEVTSVYIGFSLTSVGLWPTEVSVITVVDRG
jgi:hypothetical protein